MDEITQWIDKGLNDIVNSIAYRRYFNSIIPSVEDDRQYLTNADQGLELILSDENLVLSIHFFGDNRKSENRFEGPLPLKLDFSFSRKKVQSIFGLPQKSGGGHHHILYGRLPIWDKYILDTFSLHFEYSNDESYISLLTASSLRLEPQLNAGLQ